MRKPTTGRMWLLGLLLLFMTVSSASATVTQYPDEGTFLYVVGGVSRETFDGFTVETILSSQVDGVAFSSPNSGHAGFVPITVNNYGVTTSSPAKAVDGGWVLADPNVPQIIRMVFEQPTRALAFYIASLSPSSSSAKVRLEFADDTFEVIEIDDADEDVETPTFFAVTSTVDIVAAELGGAYAFVIEGPPLPDPVALDDLMFQAEVVEVPVCSSQPFDDGAGVVGTATDNAGIESVELAPGSSNLALDPDPNFFPGAPFITFLLTQADPNLAAAGFAVVTDTSGNTCTVGAGFEDVVEGDVEDEVLCRGQGILFQVSGSSGGGTSTCSATLPDPNGPAFPPGYEPSDPNDPFPCRELTIDSPISGQTQMVYKKDGTFDPDLRLLYSHFDGLAFPPYADITESVEEIATVVPDPTRLGGSGSWSVVKVTCATLSELCNGLDDDGDGAIDEGLPVGQLPVDADEDGFDLCPAFRRRGDCNDQIAAINPDASEVCNGMDDDCDGAIDDGNPGGGGSCAVPGQSGACAAGTLTCDNARLVCEQTVDPVPETCNGVDDDCDGVTDEVRVFGGYLPPVNADGSSIFKKRANIPFKFDLRGCSGSPVVDAHATIRVFVYANGMVGTELENIDSPGQADTGNEYHSNSAGQYQYNLSTAGLSSGKTYLVRTTLDDGSVHDVLFSLR
ncbi:MAG: PxKF domain-containing protein [Candidatus Polarisedimenticolia bacterium]